LQSVQNIVSSRTTLPILSNVLLRAGDNKLELTATDLDVTITCTVEANVKKKGSTTVPVKRFFGIVRELSSPEIELEVDDKSACSIRAGASFYKIHGLSADEFPPIQELKEDKKIVVPQEKLRTMQRASAVRELPCNRLSADDKAIASCNPNRGSERFPIQAHRQSDRSPPAGSARTRSPRNRTRQKRPRAIRKSPDIGNRRKFRACKGTTHPGGEGIDGNAVACSCVIQPTLAKIPAVRQ
jgi:hypothetical protein